MMENLNYSTKTLEKLKFGLEQRLAGEILGATVDIDKRVEFLYDDIVLQIRGYIWAEDLGIFSIEYPRDWWQAFKGRWFPVWAKNRWPVVYTQHTIDVKAKYPDYKCAFPGHEARLAILKTHSEWIDDRS